MKTFKDIVFEQHDLVKSYPMTMQDGLGFEDMIQSRVTFDNGNIISIIAGGHTYGDGINTFEVMDSDGEVHGYLTKGEVTKLMIKEQNHIWMGDIKKHKMI